MAALLRQKSPTSLKVTLRALREGARLSFDDCMRMEYRLACRFMQGHDFFEGVRALLIDKDNKPDWRPATLETVTADMVAAYFAPLPEGDLTFD
jgi:enoyl-CoA hydratase